MNKINKDEKHLRKILWVVLAVQVLLLFVIAIFFRVDDMTLSSDEIISFNKGWTLTREDGSQTKVSSLPFSSESPAGERVVLSNRINKIYAGKTLRFLSADQTVEVEVNGEIIYSFGTDDTRLFGHTPGSVVNFVDLPKNIGDGTIRIYITSPYDNYATRFSEVSIGDRDAVIVDFIKNNLLALIVCVIILFAGMVLLMLALIQRFSKQNTYGMAYIALCCFSCSLYGAIETKTLEVIWGNQTVYSFLVFFILMTMPIYLQLYYLKQLPECYGKRFRALLGLSVLNCTVQITLQICNVEDLMNLAPISHFLIFLTGLTILISLFQVICCNNSTQKNLDDAFSKRIFQFEFFAVFALIAGGMIDIVRNYVIYVGDFGSYMRIGCLVFSLAMIASHLLRVAHLYASSVAKNAYLLEREVENVEKQNKLLIQARDEAEQAKAKAQEASEAKSNFLANMSHEIRTPINAVLGMDTMILRDSKEDATLEHARDIQVAGQSLLALVNDILDFSKIESGKMEIVETQYDVSSLINDAYHMVEQRAKEKNLNLQVFNQEDIPRLLFGDEIRIRQIVTNIMTNAIKYTKEGSVTLSASCKWLESKKIALEFSVKDTGIGIAKENQGKLFDSFQRIDQKRNRNIEGTGLGLSITKQLLDLMGGTITVESEYGVGSTFSVSIPQKVLSSEPIGRFYERYEEALNEGQKYERKLFAPEAIILVVDDVPMNLKVIAGLLRETRIRVETATSGMQCLELVRKKKYDIVLLDHMMPVMDGIETLQKMNQDEQSLNRETPIIMLTANAILGAKEEYLANGFTDYLSKPVQIEELEEMLLKYLPEHLVYATGDENNAPAQASSTEQRDNSENSRSVVLEEQEAFKKEQEEEKQMSKLEQLSFLDTESGMNYCAGEEEFYLETLGDYVNENRVKELEEFYEKQDWKNYQVVIHAVKSTSLMIGANELSAHAKELEFAIKDDNPSIVLEKHESVLKEYKDTIANIQTVLAQ